MLGFDYDSYQIYYQKILQPVINEYCSQESGIANDVKLYVKRRGRKFPLLFFF